MISRRLAALGGRGALRRVRRALEYRPHRARGLFAARASVRSAAAPGLWSRRENLTGGMRQITVCQCPRASEHRRRAVAANSLKI